MFAKFIRSLSKGDTVWFVIPNAVVFGNVVEIHSLQSDNIISVKLNNVVVSQNGSETSVESLVVHASQISAWGTDNETFDHLAPHITD